jgi:hypothetical protein
VTGALTLTGCPTYRCEHPQPIPWYRFWFNQLFGNWFR